MFRLMIMRKPSHTEHANQREAAASYVAALTADLAAIARRQRLDTLAYLLEMARLEAEGVRSTGGGGNVTHWRPPSGSNQGHEPSGRLALKPSRHLQLKQGGANNRRRKP